MLIYCITVMDQWYYAKGGKQLGPVSYDELRRGLEAGKIGPADLVWTEGMEQWQPVHKVGRLMGIVDEPSGADTDLYEPHGDDEPPALAAEREFSREPVPAQREDGRIEPGSDPIEPGACLRAAFALTRDNFAIIFGAFVLLFILLAPLGSLEGMLEEAGEPTGRSLVVGVLNDAFTLFLGMGLARMVLALVDGRPAEIGMLFGEGRRLLAAFVASMLAFAMILFGLVLLILPGIWLAARLSPLLCVLVERDELGPLEAIRESFRLTEGNFWQIFGLWILSFFVVLAGLLLLFVGLVLAIPLVYVAFVISYRWLTHGRAAALAAAG